MIVYFDYLNIETVLSGVLNKDFFNIPSTTLLLFVFDFSMNHNLYFIPL